MLARKPTILNMSAARNLDRVAHVSGDGSIAPFLDELLCGHAATIMSDLPNGSIDMIVTSPPYWSAVEYDGQANAWPSRRSAGQSRSSS